VRPWARALLLLYPLAMGFTLVYTGEHYIFDVVLGWVYAVGVYALVLAYERVREGNRHEATVRANLAVAEARVRAENRSGLANDLSV
jgi:membrane-associated phospholipid phosphatase